MIDATQNLILINGENKTLQIEEIGRDDAGRFNVKYLGSSKVYRYGSEKVVWLTCSKQIDIAHNRIFIRQRRVYDLKGVFSFEYRGSTYWYVVYTSNYSQYLLDEELIIRTSCLSDGKSQSVFEYLKAVASTNILGKEEEKDNIGLLSKLYEKIDFIDDSRAIAPYLNPKKALKKDKSGRLIYPFGCNASQKRAVVCAFEHQISIIQGPPGTGKTQTILNIIANIIRKGKTVLVVSNNNSATTNVLEKLDKAGLGFIVAPLGRKGNKEAFIGNQPAIPDELQDWECNVEEKLQKEEEAENLLKKLDRIFAVQEELALSKQELQAVELEYNHFKRDQIFEITSFNSANYLSSTRLLNLWLQFQHMQRRMSLFPKNGGISVWRLFNGGG